MMTDDLEKELTKLERYLVGQGRGDFIEDMKQSPSARELKLQELVRHEEEITDTMQRDEELRQSAARTNALRYPYNEQKRMNKKLRRFIHLLQKEEGEC